MRALGHTSPDWPKFSRPLLTAILSVIYPRLILVPTLPRMVSGCCLAHEPVHKVVDAKASGLSTSAVQRTAAYLLIGHA